MRQFISLSHRNMNPVFDHILGNGSAVLQLTRLMTGWCVIVCDVSAAEFRLCKLKYNLKINYETF